MEVLRGKSWSWKHISIFLYFLLHTLLHLTILTIVKYGSFNQVSYDKRTCIGGTPDAEDIAHTLFACQLCKKDRDQYLRSHFKQMAYWDPYITTTYFMCIQNPNTWPFIWTKQYSTAFPKLWKVTQKYNLYFLLVLPFTVSCYPCLII